VDERMNDRILAKSSGETLSEHTIACLKAAQSLIDSLPFLEEKEKIRNEVLFAVAMHDVGKAATGFQKMLRKEQSDWQGKRHEIISASFAASVDGISPVIIFAILTHHKCIPSDGISQIFGCLPWEQIPIHSNNAQIWNDMVQEWQNNKVLFLKEWKRICEFLLPKSLSNHFELKPLSLNPSWLERTIGKRGQRKNISFPERYRASIVRGLTIAADHLGSANMVPQTIPELNEFPILNRKVRPFQERIGEIEGSAVLRAPTGSGKTEAALLWSQKNQRPNSRLFYILPYTASINAMYRRMRKIFGNKNVGLLHHRTTAALYSILEADTNLSSRLDKQQMAAILSDLAREIWFPVRVCTPHQILRYTLRGKGWEYMLAEFPNACFIFDEIHAYDPRVVGLTLGSARLFKKWGARFLFLSATLPAFLHTLIIDTLGELPFIEPNPEKEEDRKILDKKRHTVEIKNGSIMDHIDAIILAIRNSSSTLIVCNHVRTSQNIYSELKEELPHENIILLHSQFNQEDRNRIENEIINKTLPRVLVATQVVEVSLDVDFEQAFFEPAPIDALIQRMGRVNRSGNRPPAKVAIFTKQVNRHHLYCECPRKTHLSTCRVKLTIDILQKIKGPISERDLVEAADKIYGKGYQGEDKNKFEEGLNHPDITQMERHLLAGAHQDWVEEIIEMTDGIIEILPESLTNDYKKREEKGLWIEADSLLVPIRIKSIAWLRSEIDMSGDPWIANLSYTSDKGLEISASSHKNNFL
jgi:CRISPR-associated endonuclease/helicase Cas3